MNLPNPPEDLEANGQRRRRDRNRFDLAAERQNSGGALDFNNMSEGSSCDLAMGCLLGWFFGILGICCLFNRRY